MPTDYAFNYTAVIVAAGFGFGGIGFTFILSRLLAPKRPSLMQTIAYECGIIPEGQGNTKYNIRYYLFALFFLIFAVDTDYYLCQFYRTFWYRMVTQVRGLGARGRAVRIHYKQLFCLGDPKARSFVYTQKVVLFCLK